MNVSANKITPVILCGGKGTRLWPRSRAAKPKPFLPLVRDETLFEQALLRCADAAHFHAPIIVTGAQHVGLVESQLTVAPEAELIVEPMAKNTAAAIALAAMRLPQDSIMLVCPSDHHIGDFQAFINAVKAAAELANDGWLVAFGIEPRGPEIGFGYLRKGEAIGKLGFKVAQFVEKPDFARAQAYLESGEYAWNGGIFAFGVRHYLAELERYRPEMVDSLRQAIDCGSEEGRHFYPGAASFANIVSESVDYALMENTVRAAMIPAEMAWSDVGNWRDLHGARDRDEFGNAIRGPAEIVDCRNVLVESDGPTVHLIGLNDVIVVIDGNDVMITSANGAHKVGTLRAATTQ